MAQALSVEEEWKLILSGNHPSVKRFRHVYKFLPANPRCKWCNAPFNGLGGQMMRAIGKRPSNLNPKFCNICENFARSHLGGAEIELSMLFADVRDSTTLAEEMSSVEFSRLISRFYTAASDVMIQSDALIDKLVGDQVDSFYIQGFCGADFAKRAVQASHDLLSAVGYGSPEGPWIPAGAGVHTGRAFVGAVGSEAGIADVTALGDAVNIAARLASSARPGEILVSEETMLAAGLSEDGLEQRELELKGRTQPVRVRVLRVAQNL